jgi:hypothetical protein
MTSGEMRNASHQKQNIHNHTQHQDNETQSTTACSKELNQVPGATQLVTNSRKWRILPAVREGFFCFGPD